MKIKQIALALMGVAALGAVSASYAATELKIWCWDDHFNVPAARLAGERFAQKHPDVTVKVESIAQDNTIQKLNAALGANNLRGLPDIVLIEDYRSKNFAIGYPDFLKDLKGIVDHSKFVDYKVAASSVGDKTYGVPFDSGVTALFIRMDLFEKAGYKLSDFNDLTWSKFIEMGKRVKAMTGTPLLPYDPSDLMEMRTMLQSAGAWYTDSQDVNKVTLKDNQVLKAGFEVYKKLNDEALVLPYSGWNQFLSTFQSGKVAAVLSSCWLVPSFESNTADAGKWRVVNIPRLDNVPNATNYSNQGGSQWYVNAHSANADLAAQFLAETFGSDTELINELVPKIGLISTMKEVENLPNYQKPNAYFGNQLVAKHFIEWNAQIPPVNYGMHTKAVESIVQEALQRYLAGEDMDTVLSDAQEMAQMQIM